MLAYGWGAMVAAGLFAGIAAVIVAMVRVRRARAQGAQAADLIQSAWHRYEIGDLTEWEFARLVTPRPAMEPRYTFPAASAMPAVDAAGAHDAAAD